MNYDDDSNPFAPAAIRQPTSPTLFVVYFLHYVFY